VLTTRTDGEGNPYGVFCSNRSCPGYWEIPEAHPIWSQDCPMNGGILVCPMCGSPAMVPETSFDG